MTNLKEIFLVQLDSVLNLYEKIKVRTKYSDFSDQNLETFGQFTLAALAVIERVAGNDSTHANQARLVIERLPFPQTQIIPYLAGIVRTLRDEVEADFLKSAREFIQGELFGDFLEMASFLLNEGYKDAAAVIVGGVIEVHLRKLCVKNSIAVEITENGQTKAKKADRLNSELAVAKIYSKLDQKNLTAWLDLRNRAAHAQYNEYTKDQVSLLLQGVRDFIARCSA